MLRVLLLHDGAAQTLFSQSVIGWIIESEEGFVTNGRRAGMARHVETCELPTTLVIDATQPLERLRLHNRKV